MGCNKNNAFFVTYFYDTSYCSFISYVEYKNKNRKFRKNNRCSPSDCYDLTYSFVKEQNTDERYISLNTYLKSLTPLCIVIIVFYSIKIIFTLCFSGIIEPDMMDWANGMYLCYMDVPARIISFIPIIVCVILLRTRGYTTNCEVFMNYYEQCSIYYGDDFIDKKELW